MDRERIVQLAIQSGYGDGFADLHARSLARFAALIEAEVCGDAEPVAYIGTDGSLGWLKKPSALFSKAVPLYTHPTPAVVAQLVDALAGLIDFIEIDNLKIDQDALRIARAALAAAKENGL